MPRRKERFDRTCKAEGCPNIVPADAHAQRLYCSTQCRARNKDRAERFAQFGATPNDYDRLLMEQEGRCAICGSTEPGRKGITAFSFDHDHEANVARGLLCWTCNVGLGSFMDDPALLLAAIRYLETHSRPRETGRPYEASIETLASGGKF